MKSTTVTTKSGTFIVLPGSGSRKVVDANGTVVGSLFRMSGDRHWAVTSQDWRGKSFTLYFDTAALAVEFLVKA